MSERLNVRDDEPRQDTECIKLLLSSFKIHAQTVCSNASSFYFINDYDMQLNQSVPNTCQRDSIYVDHT